MGRKKEKPERDEKKTPEEDEKIEELVRRELRREAFRKEKLRGNKEIRIEQFVNKKMRKAAIRAKRVEEGGGAVSPYQESVRQQDFIQKRFREAIFNEVRQEALLTLKNEGDFQKAQEVMQDALQKPLVKPDGPQRTYSTSLRAPFFIRHFLHPNVLRQPVKHLERFFPENRYTRHKKDGTEEVRFYEFAMHKYAKELDEIVDDELAAAFERKPRLYFRALAIYKQVFALALKKRCWQLNDLLHCPKTKKAWKKYLTAEISRSKFNETELRHVIGGSANFEQIGHKSYDNAARSTLTLQSKLVRFHEILERPEFRPHIATYVYSGFLPRYVKRTIAGTWGKSDARAKSDAWVRNTTFGWRRRLDPLLPVQFRKELVPEAIQKTCNKLKKSLKKRKVAITPDLELGLQVLTKYRLLDLLLSNESLQGMSGLMPQRCWAAAERARSAHTGGLTSGNPFEAQFPHAMQLTRSDFMEGCNAVLREGEGTIQSLEAEKSKLKGIPTGARTVSKKMRLKQLSSILSKLRAFAEAIRVLRDDSRIHDFILKFKFFDYLLPGSRQLFGLAKLLSRLFPTNRKYPVQAALGATVSRACLHKYLGEPAKVVQTVINWMTPKAILTAPFCSKTRTRTLLPLDLLGRSYVVYREVAHGRMHHLLLAQVSLGWHPTLTFTMPKEHVVAAWKELKHAKKRVLSKRRKKRRGKTHYMKVFKTEDLVPEVLCHSAAFNALFERKLPMEAPLTDKMIDFLEAGAAIHSSRLMPPRPSNYKVTCQLVFGMKKGEKFPSPPQGYIEEVFKEKMKKRQKKKKYAKSQWKPKLTVPRIPTLKRRKRSQPRAYGKPTKVLYGVDVNRPSKEVVSLATTLRILDISAEAAQAVKLGKKIQNLRKQIAKVQRALDRSKSSGRGSVPVGRLVTELAHLHRRKSALKATLDKEVTKCVARVMVKTRAGALAAEDLHVDPRGQPKPIAIATTDMPKKEAIMENAVRLVIAYHEAMEPGSGDTFKFFRVPAYGTSRFCADCGTELESLQDKYDLMYCPTCRKVVNRHGNAARNIAGRGQDVWGRFLTSLGVTP